MENKKFPIIVFSSLLFLAGCSTSADINRVQELKGKTSNGVVSIDNNFVDAGTIKMSEGKVDIPFTFRNTGSEPVVLLDGATSCMCTEAVVKGSDGTLSPRIKMPGHGPIASVFQILDPGEEAELIATFDPNAHGPQAVGPIVRDVVIKTNSSKTPEIRFEFKGNVVK